MEPAQEAAPKGKWSRTLVTIVIVIVVLAVVGGTTAYVLLTAPPPQKVLVVGTTDDEITFDPADSYDYFSINIIQNTMSMLLTYQPGTTTLAPSILSEVPTLANGGISADGLTYTLRIRSDAKFEDGTPIDADVVKRSIDRVVRLNGQPAFLLEPIVNATEYWNAPTAAKDSAWANYTASGVVKVDDLTVKVRLRRAWSPFASLLAFSVTAPVHPTAVTEDRFYPNVIISSGPYRLVSYFPHQRYELEANPNYWGDPPTVPRVTVVRYATAADLKLAIQTGEVDVAYRSLLPEDFNALKQDTSLRTLEGESPVIRYLVFNVCDDAGVTDGWCPRATPFADKQVRQALAYLTDRGDIATAAYKGTVSPLYSLVPAGMFGHEDVFKTVYGENPNVAAANALLEAAGFTAAQPFRFTLWYTPSHYGDPEIFVAQSLKRAWEQSDHIEVILNSEEWAQYRASWRAGNYDVFLLGWFPDYFDSDNYVFPFLHAESGGTAQFGNWYKNATLDTVIEDQAATSDPTERATLFGEIQDALAADVPYIPLFQTKQVVVFRPNVSGIVLDPIQFFRYFTIDVS